MGPVAILYASLTFNTHDAATALHGMLMRKYPDRTFVLCNAAGATAESIREYSVFIFGMSTWDDGHNADTEAFMRSLSEARPDLSGTRWAIFGLGESSYPEFCASAYQTKDALGGYGAHIHEPVYTIDGYPTDELLEGLAEWSFQFLNA